MYSIIIITPTYVMCIPTQNDSFFNIKLEKTEVVWYLLTFLLLRNEDMVESCVSLLRGVGGDGDGNDGGDGVFLVYALLHTSWLILIFYYRLLIKCVVNSSRRPGLCLSATTPMFNMT